MGDLTQPTEKVICLDTDEVPDGPMVMVKNIALTDDQLQALVDNHDYEGILIDKTRKALLRFVRMVFAEMEYYFYCKQMEIGREPTLSEERLLHYLEWEDDLRYLCNNYEGGNVTWPEPQGWLFEKLMEHGIEYPPNLI